MGLQPALDNRTVKWSDIFLTARSLLLAQDWSGLVIVKIDQTRAQNISINHGLPPPSLGPLTFKILDNFHAGSELGWFTGCN